ncbi:tape measure protein [Pseudomonas sp. ODNR1LW]|nr:tape measure protein [Pseudomonas sp. ODNR1LW]
MARRVAELDFRTTGIERETPRVRTLTQALAEQKREVAGLVPAYNAAQRGGSLLGSVSAASAGQIALMTGALGPLGAGLAGIVSRAPGAASGLLAVASAQERMGLLSRASNIAILGGAAAMTTAGIAAAAYAGDILRGADAYAAMTSRLKIFSDGTVAAAQNEQALYESAREARTSVEGLSSLFVRITPAVSDMGRAQADALAVTEATSKALAIQGATASESIASTIQFSQAIASGVLRGDELRSMLESSPLLLRYIAQNLEINGKVGVAFGQLRKLGEEGAITAEKLVAALLRAQPQIEKDFINAPKTAQQGWQVLRDTITRTVGQLAQTTGLQQGVFGFLNDLTTRLDGFREQVMLDPSSLEPAIRAGQMFGEVLETAGEIAGGVVENFDLIVAAGQALIALKAGEVLAAGFAAAAAKARDAYAAVQNFRANGVFTAAATGNIFTGDRGDAVGAAAAINARAAATAAEARAVDLKAQAEVRARTATAARAAADAASAEVTRLKAAAGTQAALISEAEARASALVTAAERAETAAKSATAAATNAAAAASTRSAVAQQAELAVTSQVTNAYAVKAAVGRGLSGVYALLGGGVGVLTLALGGLIYAVWQSQQAWEEKVRTLRDTVVVSDELRAISDQLASATWAEVPALQAAAAAHREKAAAALEDARASLQAANAGAARNAAAVGRGSPYPGAGSIMDPTAEVRARDLRRVVADGERDLWKAEQEQFVLDARARVLDSRRRAQQNQTGRNDAGGALSADQRAANARTIEQNQAWATQQLQSLSGRVAGAEATLRANPNSQAHAAVVTALRRSQEAALELTMSGAAPTRTAPASSGGGKAAKMSSEDRQALALLQRVAEAAQVSALMGRTPSADTRFSVRDGRLFDGDTAFVARSEDEARAAAAYLEQIEAITTAKDSLVAETDQTRAALAAQAAQTLATALSTSQATQADQRWAEKMAETRGESVAVAQAEREVAEQRRQGAAITDEAAQAYVNLIRAQEAQRRTQEALNAVRPVVQDVTQRELTKMGRTPQKWRPDTGGMGFDVDAALREWGEARIRIEAEVERSIRADIERQAQSQGWSRERIDRETSEKIAAMRVAINAQNAEQIADIWQRQRDEDAQAWEDRLQDRLDQERELADSITGTLEDLAMGGDPSDLGRRFGEDLLRAIWQELVTNPLNLAIRTALRSLTSGDGSGGLWSSVLSAFGFGGTGGGSGGVPADLAGLYRDGGLPGFDRGGLVAMALRPGLIRGPGGPRDDRILARVSNREFISNAEATGRNLPLLQALNAGMSLTEALRAGVPAFAAGGLPGGVTADLIARDFLSGDMGYAYPAQTADNDRSSAETGRASATAPQVNIINQSSQPVQAEATMRDGQMDIRLFDQVVEGSIKRAGAKGSLAKALAQTPQKRRR